jgi:hypothetical protein
LSIIYFTNSAAGIAVLQSFFLEQTDSPAVILCKVFQPEQREIHMPPNWHNDEYNSKLFNRLKLLNIVAH